MPVTPGSSSKLNTVRGVSAMLVTTAAEEISLATKVLPANILVKDDLPILIDFGLGKYSNLLEDKGTDLLVFKKTLKTIIPEESDKLFGWFLDGYDNKEIVKKIDEIEKRGRYL